MELKIKAVGAYYTPEGVVADTPNNPKYAEYKEETCENTYRLYVTAEYAPAAVSLRISRAARTPLARQEMGSSSVSMAAIRRLSRSR